MKNRTPTKCPFEIVYTKASRLTFDLTNLPTGVELQDQAEYMTKRIQKLHKEVLDHLIKNTASYKEEKDKMRREVSFRVGDLVMAHLRKKSFPARTYSKLKGREIGPCKFQAKYEPNVYKLELLEGINISPVFNVADLMKYHAPDRFQLANPTRKSKARGGL